MPTRRKSMFAWHYILTPQPSHTFIRNNLHFLFFCCFFFTSYFCHLTNAYSIIGSLLSLLLNFVMYSLFFLLVSFFDVRLRTTLLCDVLFEWTYTYIPYHTIYEREIFNFWCLAKYNGLEVGSFCLCSNDATKEQMPCHGCNTNTMDTDTHTHSHRATLTMSIHTMYWWPNSNHIYCD